MGGVIGKTEPSRLPERLLLEKGLAYCKAGLGGGSLARAFDVVLPPPSTGTPAVTLAAGGATEQPQHIHTVWVRPDSSESEARHPGRMPGAGPGAGAGAAVPAFQELATPPVDQIGQRVEDSNTSPMVLLHGYGSGVGIYFAALPLLAQRYAGPVLAVDSLGCGLSSRPVHTDEIGFGAAPGATARTEQFFVDGLERWRQAMGFEKMTLVAHSLGGYVSVCYALAHPDRIERLVLVGCAGLPPPPPPAELAARVASRGVLLRMLLWSWEQGHSPFRLARFPIADALSPGKYLMSRYTARRFDGSELAQADPAVTALLANYFYENWAYGEISTGGYSHATILGPMAYTRAGHALWGRIPTLRLANKLTFVYGEGDWMDPANALALQAAMATGELTPEIETEVLLVPDAGHNVMIDRPAAFTDAVITAVTTSSPQNRRIHSNSAEPEVTPPARAN